MEIREKMQEATGFFSTKFYYAFRAMFFPVTRFLQWAHVTPNMVTFASMILGAVMGVCFALDRFLLGMAMGLAMAFSDIVDGQLAKACNAATPFGGILDSPIDRYNEFFIFAGFGARYYLQGRPLWVLACASAFLGSVMISYVKARAEADGYSCKVGRLQRPERLSLIGVAVLMSVLGFDIGIDVVVLFFAVGTHATTVHRLLHVRRQSR